MDSVQAKGNIKAGIRLFGFVCAAWFLCLFVVMSFAVIFQSSFADKSYMITTSDGVFLSEQIEKPEKDSLEEGLVVVPKYTLPTRLHISRDILILIFNSAIFLIITSSIISEIACKDRLNKEFNGVESDKNRGLKIALIAGFPSICIYIYSIFFRALFPNNGFFALYRLINMVFAPVFDMITGWTYIDGMKPSSISILQTVILGFNVLILPLVGLVVYRMVLNGNSKLSKYIYKSQQEKHLKKEKKYYGPRLGGR